MKVTFDNVYNAFQIIAPKGTMISFTGEPTALADGVYLVGDDGIINLDEQFLTDTLYLSTEGTDYAVTGGMRVTYPLGDETVIIRAGSSTIPFSKGGKGGGGSGGDNTHYKGTTTTPISNGSTTNPITIDGESYTAVFGDIVVYGYTEFVFDGTTWSEFGRPFDTTPTSGSANAVTSDGIYKRTPFARNTNGGAQMGGGTASGAGGACIAVGSYSTASGINSFAFGTTINANQTAMMAIGTANNPRSGDLFNIGNGGNASTRSNIVEVNRTSFNVNGDIKKNNVSLPTPYTTMPTITEEMVGQIAMYVGETTNDYVKGYFYIASSDGAAEPTYSWVSMVDSTPTSGSTNLISSDGVYMVSPWSRGTGVSSAQKGIGCVAGGYGSIASGYQSKALASGAVAIGNYIKIPANYNYLHAVGNFNSTRVNDIFEIGNGTSNDERSNILEANATSVNINGEIKKNGVSLPTPYTTMPTITAAMLGQIAQYVGTTDANYTKGWFYEAVSDGEETPTYSWEAISFNSGGGGGETETNIIPLATPNVVVVDSDSYSSVYKNDYDGITFSKSYNYGAQPSCYIDVSSLVASDILCSSNTKIKIHAFLTSNWGGALSNTLQMYIGDGAPTSDDWVTVVTHAVSESSPYGYYDTIDVSDINVSGTSDGRIYFRMIHGSETTSYNTWIQIVSLDIIHTATPEEPSVTFKGGIIDELYTYEVIE